MSHLDPASIVGRVASPTPTPTPTASMGAATPGTPEKPAITYRNVTLSRSRVVTSIPSDWEVADTLAAQRHGKGDPSLTNLALIQRTVKFGGEHWTITDIEQRLTGRDILQLQSEFFGDEDAAGNG